MAALLVLLMGSAFATATAWTPAPPPRFTGLGTRDVPRSVGGYGAPGDDPMPPEVKVALASADVVARRYVDVDGTEGEAIDFVSIGGTDRTALHDPRSCLVGAGWRLEGDHTEALPGAGVDAHACRAVGRPGAAGDDAGRTGAAGLDIVYLYVVDGRVIDRVTQIRAAMLWSALLGRKNTPVYFLRFTRPLSDDPQRQQEGHARLLGFAAHMWTRLKPRLLRKTQP